jgi:hypothetical protein
MRNKLSSFFLSAGLLSVLSLVMFSCKKDKIVTADKQVAFFVSTGTGNYTITAPSQTYKVYVGLTKASEADRVVNVAVTSPTGAAQGTQYTLSSSTVTFEAGTVIDSIIVTANYAAYTAGRKDTLSFAFTNASDGTPTLNNSYKLRLRGPCFEGDFEPDALKGNFPGTIETFPPNPPYGPYSVTISTATPITATTAKITVGNIWDFGWNPIEFILDWTDPLNRTVTPVAASSGIADASTINSAYAGSQVAVRPFAGQPGTFSFCSGTIVLRMQLGVAGAVNGWFTALYTVTPAK